MLKHNILNIDEDIKQKIEMEFNRLPDYETTLSELKRSVKILTLSETNRKNINSNIEVLETKIENIKNKRDIRFYVSEVSFLLERYRQILMTPKKISFCGVSKSDDSEKEEITRKYLDIVKKYFKDEIGMLTNTEDARNKKTDLKVECCNCDNKECFDVIDNCVYICQECGAQQEILLHTSSFNDIDRVNISGKYTYDRKIHFRDCVNQYQGVGAKLIINSEFVIISNYKLNLFNQVNIINHPNLYYIYYNMRYMMETLSHLSN